jgi:hypothetical protein
MAPPLGPCLLLWYFHPRKMWGYVGIWCSPNTLKSPQILFPKNTLPWWRVFYLAKNTLEWRGFVWISRDYSLKTRTSKQPIGEILGYEIIPSHPLKYPRSKQGLDTPLGSGAWREDPSELAWLRRWTWNATQSKQVLRPCLLLPYFHSRKMWGYMWRFGVHPILSNPLKYSSSKILYHDGEFLF